MAINLQFQAYILLTLRKSLSKIIKSYFYLINFLIQPQGLTILKIHTDRKILTSWHKKKDIVTIPMQIYRLSLTCLNVSDSWGKSTGHLDIRAHDQKNTSSNHKQKNPKILLSYYVVISFTCFPKSTKLGEIMNLK